MSRWGADDFHRPDVEPIEAGQTVWAEWEVWVLAALSILCGMALGVICMMLATAWNAERLEATPLAPVESVRPEARP
jgi:hypothetical protein